MAESVHASALRATADGIVLIDAAGRIAFANAAFAAARGRPEKGILGRALADLLQPLEERAVEAILADVRQGGHWRGDLRPREVESTEAVLEATLTRIDGGNGSRRAPTVVGVVRDVSAQHLAAQQRADFLSTITHDIKVPLTVILGYTEMLTDPEPPPGEIPPDILTRIRESGETIHALVCNFLDLSRIEAGRMTLDPRPFDLSAMLAHALEHYDSTARRKGLTLSLEAETLPPVVADESQLQRVVANLLGNAIKYTPRGGRITISTGREKSNVAVAFKDTGRGIPADEIPHLFEKYRRVREQKRTEGTGLGLFIAKTIVDAHGGDIRVQSTPGVGSTFTILLPAN